MRGRPTPCRCRLARDQHRAIAGGDQSDALKTSCMRAGPSNSSAEPVASSAIVAVRGDRRQPTPARSPVACSDRTVSADSRNAPFWTAATGGFQIAERGDHDDRIGPSRAVNSFIALSPSMPGRRTSITTRWAAGASAVEQRLLGRRSDADRCPPRATAARGPSKCSLRRRTIQNLTHAVLGRNQMARVSSVECRPPGRPRRPVLRWIAGSGNRASGSVTVKQSRRWRLNCSCRRGPRQFGVRRSAPVRSLGFSKC